MENKIAQNAFLVILTVVLFFSFFIGRSLLVVLPAVVSVFFALPIITGRLKLLLIPGITLLVSLIAFTIITPDVFGVYVVVFLVLAVPGIAGGALIRLFRNKKRVIKRVLTAAGILVMSVPLWTSVHLFIKPIDAYRANVEIKAYTKKMYPDYVKISYPQYEWYGEHFVSRVYYGSGSDEYFEIWYNRSGAIGRK
ncbi:MAG: hypothetical protein FWF82_03060 [Oscillospiraceae bacterium]|nr:hypothetical protein [Oscillospiraceae bacterium]